MENRTDSVEEIKVKFCSCNSNNKQEHVTTEKILIKETYYKEGYVYPFYSYSTKNINEEA